MKIAGARGITRSRGSLIALLALAATIGLAGCEGEDGRAGPEGPSGGPGPTGPTGPTGPIEVPIEQGGPVTLGDGSTLTAEQIEQIGGLVATIDSASVDGTPAPVVEFTVKTAHGGPVLGLAPTVTYFMVAKLVDTPNDGFPARWQSYVNRVGALYSGTNGTSPGVLPDGAIQANTERATAGQLEELGDGQYRYTYGVDLDNVTTPLAVAYEPSLTHRVGLEIRMSGAAEELAPDNPTMDIVPDGGAGSGHKLVAATENCADCHKRFDLHGGPRRTVEYCVTCHNPATVDPDTGEDVGMAYMTHSIHYGEARANPYVVWGFTGPFDFSEVTYPQSVLFCETCHTASDSSPDGDAWKSNPSASACGACHNAGLNKTGPDAATGRYTYTYTHTDFDYTANDNACGDCHRPGGSAGDILEVHVKGDRLLKTLGEQFKFEILGVTNVGAGLAPNIKFKVSKPDGTAYDVVNDPAFATSGASLNINIAWDVATDITNAAADGSEPGLRSGTSARRSGYTLQMRIAEIQAAAATAGQSPDGSYTIPFFTPVPAGTADLMVQMDGHPLALPPGETDWANAEEARPGMTVFYTGKKRAELVTEAKCNACHEQLAFHGGNRNGNPQACLVCHNASGGYADDDEIAGPIAMGAMAHNIHAGVMPRNADITYPQSLANCEACHLPGTYYGARPGAIGISTGSGADLFNMTDDTWDSATAGTCGTCHNSGAAKTHMTQNGGLFGVVGGKTFTPSSSSEACAVCHGEGRAVDTAKAHAE